LPNGALGGDGDPDWIPDWPKGMLQRTYEGLAAKRYGDQADAVLGMEIAPLLARLRVSPKR
jgi:hypothetical protein